MEVTWATLEVDYEDALLLGQEGMPYPTDAKDYTLDQMGEILGDTAKARRIKTLLEKNEIFMQGSDYESAKRSRFKITPKAKRRMAQSA
jgi:hypothetical protein